MDPLQRRRVEWPDAGIRVAPDGVAEMTVLGPWTPAADEAVRSRGVSRLVLNYAMGFDEADLGFLRGLPISELSLLDRRIEDLGPLYGLSPTLRSLTLEVAPRAELDLARLPGLTSLAAVWPAVRRSVAACTTVESLYLEGYDRDDLAELTHLPLQELVLKERPKVTSLDGVERLAALRTLRVLRAARLERVDALTGLGHLGVLDLERCRQVGCDPVISTLAALTRLNLSETGPMQTLAPIRGCEALETVHLYGSTNVLDGDLSPLLSLPRLRELRMRERAHYSPSVAQIQRTLDSGGPRGADD